MRQLMHDAAYTDLLRRLACMRGHLEATVQMVECGANDLAVVRQLRAVRGALTQIQVRLLRVWMAEHAQGQPLPDQTQQVERELSAILKRRRRHAYHSHH